MWEVRREMGEMGGKGDSECMKGKGDRRWGREDEGGDHTKHTLPCAACTVDVYYYLSYCVCTGRGSSACVFASTMGSVVMRYSITLPLPHTDSRLVDINRAFPVGER